MAPTAVVTVFRSRLRPGVEEEYLPTAGHMEALARQIDLGADADLFLSADQASADFLAGRGLVARRCKLLTNRLVVIRD